MQKTLYRVTREDQKGNAHYTVRWSPWVEIEKYTVLKSLPSESGILEIYEKKGRLLDLKDRILAYYGGIRNTLLELLDPDSQREYSGKTSLIEGNGFCRFSITPHYQELADLMHFYAGSPSSGRFNDIFVFETEVKSILRADKDTVKLTLKDLY